jgi:cytoskeletal protein CcmA (bactofilin family)
MNLKKLIITALVLALPVVAFLGTAGVYADSFRSNRDAIVGKDETIDSTLFITGATVTITGTVNGDVFCAGQNVIVTGTVNGDVICAGQSIRVAGQVSGDVRLAGQFVTLGGAVQGNATLAGQSITFEDQGAVAGDLTVAGTSASIFGKVGRDLGARSDELTLAGLVSRNVDAETDGLTLAKTARVTGNLNYTSGKDAAILGQVQGQTNRHDPPQTDKKSTAATAVAALGYGIISMLVLSMVLVLIAPQSLQAVTDEGMRRPGRALIAGFIAAIVAPVLAVVLAFTFVGLPLAVLVGLSWIIVLILCGPVFAYYVGRQVMRNSDNALIIMLVGALLVLVLYAVPVLNILVGIAVVVFGSGMIVSRIIATHKRPHYRQKAIAR